ncbi:hypothetical protein N658DRAFT_39535 [Parathielavia hyrcaniae]|uniref:Uncharacterized protein n=1 Tax=Parathielavia hyrcaniae TaxID=113614 RepID=A0AAN6Q1K2_9PEZI|nr:hypothetical protein N658DRAFT_39535 [Parathielavia hyrcaniae]
MSRQRSEKHLQSILRPTCSIIFLGTPHHGAGLAKWAELLSRSIGLVKQTNSNIVEVLRRDSVVLARIQESFHTMVMAQSREGLPPIEISCFYEELPLRGVGLVVPQDSAILPSYIPIGIHSNHMDMTKFTSTHDPGFVAVSGELRRWIRDIDAAKSHHENPPFSNNQDCGEQRGTAVQYGDGNWQFNNLGTGTQKNVDSNYFEAKGDQNFVIVPSPPRSRWGERKHRRRPALPTMMIKSISRNHVEQKPDPSVHSHEDQACLCSEHGTKRPCVASEIKSIPPGHAIQDHDGTA